MIPYRGGDHGGDGGGDNQDHGDNQDELGECLQQCIPEFEHAILELGNRTPKVITLYCGPQRMDQCEDLPITAKRLTKPLVVVGSECKCFGLNQRQLSSNKHAFDVTTNDKYQDLFCMAGEAMMEPKAKPSEEQDDGLRFVPRVMGVVKCPSFFHGCFITQSLPELSLGGSREVGGEEETKWLCVNPNRFRLIVSITIKTTTGPEQYSVELPSFASLCMTSRCTLTVPKNGPNMPGYLVVFADGYLTNITPPKVFLCICICINER